MENEIAAGKLALKTIKDSLALQEIIVKSFEEELAKLPEKEKPLNKSNGIG